MTSDSTDDRHPVELLAEEFVERQRNGENPSIDEYADAHPELASDIRELFPAITAVEFLKADSGDTINDVEAATIEQLGDFRVIGEIGRGGMGVVYEVEQVTLGRRVALKVLPRQAVADEARRERFKREAQTAAALHHTNIVPIFGVGESDGHHFYVMQLIRGVGLDRIVTALRGESGPSQPSTTNSMIDDVVSNLCHEVTQTHTFEEPAPTTQSDANPVTRRPDSNSPLAASSYYRNVARIGAQIASALQYAHGQNTLHRDVKPANLLLDANGTAWITDFGLAKALEQVELTRSGDVVGTLRYMAPEQMRGEFDARTDIYALGLSIYELATLQPAHGSRDRGRLLAEISEGRPARVTRINPRVPLDLATIIEKACAQEPRDRYANAGELADDLERFLDDRPIRARRVSVIEASWRWCRRNRALAVSGMVALVAIVAAATLGWINSASSRRAAQALSEQYRELDRAKQLTEANLQLSLSAFNAIIDEICGQDSSVPTLEQSDDGDYQYVPASTTISPDKLSVLEQTLGFYTRFTEQNADNPELVWECAASIRRAGTIQLQLGKTAEATQSFRQAIKLIDDAQAAPMKADPVLETAKLYNQLGGALLAQSQPRDAIEQHERAARILGEAGDAALTSDQRFELARAHDSMGFAFRELQFRDSEPGADGPGRRGPGRNGPRRNRSNRNGPDRNGPGRPRNLRGRRGPPGSGRRRGPGPGGRRGRDAEPTSEALDQALAHHGQALSQLDKLLADAPNNPVYLLTKARTLRNLAQQPPARDFDPTEFAVAATAILDGLVAEFPEVPTFRFELAQTLMASGRSRPPHPGGIRRVRPKQVDQLQRANDLLGELAKTHAAILAFRTAHADSLHELGRALFDDGEPDYAEQPLAAALEAWIEILRGHPGVERHIRHRARATSTLHAVLLRLDRAEESRAITEECIRDLEKIGGEGEQIPRLIRNLLVRQLEHLSRSLDRLDDREGATDARNRVRSLQRWR